MMTAVRAGTSLKAKWSWESMLSRLFGSMLTEPEVDSILPARHFRNVDLPAPLAPMSP